MTLEATAQALAADTALPEEVATTTTEDDDLSAAFDRISSEGVEDEAEQPESDVEATEQEAEPEAPVVEAPTDVPVALRKHWQAMDPEAREAIVTSQREMSRKLSDMGREVQGLSPIKSVLVQAAKEMPGLANMRPDEVASQVFQLAKISNDFKTKPLDTFIGLAKQHGMVDALRQALGGNAEGATNTAAMQQEIIALKEQLSRAVNPDFIREQVSAVTMQERLTADVQAFAAEHEHWADVEGVIPEFIPAIKAAMPNASAKDVLARAYDFALQAYRPDLKAKAQAAVKAADVPDPERAKAAIQAKSVNVTGKVSGEARKMTEEEILSAAYDRATRK